MGKDFHGTCENIHLGLLHMVDGAKSVHLTQAKFFGDSKVENL